MRYPPTPARDAGKRRASSHGRSHSPAAAAAEALERRALLSVTPAGPEFRASTTETFLENTRFSSNTVAMAPGGGFVVVWDGNASGVGGSTGQRFDAAGEPQGQPFALSEDARAVNPSVASDASGNFVVTFERYLESEAKGSAWLRRFSADGVAKGPESRVTQSVLRRQAQPTVAVEADGDFVVAWTVLQEGEGDSDVYARRFDANGTPRDDAFLVNTYTPKEQSYPALAANADGDFVVTWESWEQDGSMQGVYGQLFDGGGERIGEEFQVNQAWLAQQLAPSVAMDAAGGFAVTWWSSDGGVMLRRFDAVGAPLHDEVDADGPMASGNEPAVASDSEGRLVLVWQSYASDADFYDVFFRRFGADGSPLGEGARVNTTGPGRQDEASVALLSVEDFVVVWTDGEVGFPSNANDLPDGVYGRRFVPGPAPAATVAGRHVFYNNSSFDANGGEASPFDDGAVANDKAALRPGEPARFANVSGYDKGINGVMADIANLPAGQTLTADDFDFGAAGAPTSVTVRAETGVNGSDRVTLIWRDYNPQDASPLPQAVGNGWLTVTVKANAHTGLLQPDVFSFGSLIGETGDGTTLRVSALDLSAVRRALNLPAPLTSATDFNRDGRTNALDLSTVKRNLNHALPMPGAQAAAPTQAVPVLAPTAAIPGRTRRVADDILV